MKEQIIDTLNKSKEIIEASAAKSSQSSHWFELLLDKNPGLFTVLITGLLLPIAVLIITNRNSKKIKELEKELDQKYQGKQDVKNQEKAVYSSLSKILFDVQQLHVALSGTCIDKNCIDSAVSKFDISITKYHEEISNNLLYMPSVVIDNIYKFYSKISDLKISLKEWNDSKNFEMAHVSVYSYSVDLADIVIDIQELFVAENAALKQNFDKAEQEMMKYCCGRKPPQEVLERYIELSKQINPDISEDEIERLRALNTRP